MDVQGKSISFYLLRRFSLNNYNVTIEIESPFYLGRYPTNLGELLQNLAKRPNQYGKITINSSWFDISILSSFALSLRSCCLPEPSIHIRFATDQKYSFLWRLGFFSASRIDHNGSAFKVSPDIWGKTPSDLTSRANFSPIIVFNLDKSKDISPENRGYSQIVKETTYSLISELENTHIYPYVVEEDLIQSKEYLHIVLWELIQNVFDHANSGYGAVAAQFICNGNYNSENALKGLKAQHESEEQYCVLPKRKSWLISKRTKDYLLLSCVDMGIGIQDSIRTKKHTAQIISDDKLLEMAFERECSDHDTYNNKYAIHGLHLIKQLVASYDGYLFVQSGNASLEIDALSTSSSMITEQESLPGTIFQLLLPLSAGEPRRFITPIRNIDKNETAHMHNYVMYMTEELRKFSFLLPPPEDKWNYVVDKIVRRVSSVQGPLFLDFVGMPRERQFISLLLLCIRRRKLDYPVVVLNASEELFAAVAGIRIDNKIANPVLEISEINKTLSTEMSRGDTSVLLPLIVVITRLSNDKKRIAVQWLGILSQLSDQEHSILTSLLDELYFAEGELSNDHLEKIAVLNGCKSGTAWKILSNVSRVNPNLLSYNKDTDEWHFTITASGLYYDAIESMSSKLLGAIEKNAKHLKPSEEYLYFLNWRTGCDAYLHNYYQLWNVVSKSEYSKNAGTLLLRLAHDHSEVGAYIPTISGLVSVTSSAGQVAREIARILRVPHWEAASVYDIQTAEWPINFRGDSILIIDDLIDTGTATKSIIDEFSKSRRNAKCIAVLAVLASNEGISARLNIPIPIIQLFKVDLGRPTESEILLAEKEDKILEIDPHTLEPLRRKRFKKNANNKNQSVNRDELLQLAKYKGLRSGHFAYGGHHFYEFFDIVQYMGTHEGFEELSNWLKKSINDWFSSTVLPIGGKSAKVTLIYPYYSPVAAFLHRIGPLLEDMFDFPCNIHVARPYQRSKTRLGYRLNSFEEIGKFAVFLDDGIATGGTLSEIVDAFVALQEKTDNSNDSNSQINDMVLENPQAAILALVVFDRIGMNPRKHLKSVRWYKNGVKFSFLPKHSLNLRSYYSKDCPLCRIKTDAYSLFDAHPHLRKHIEGMVEPLMQLLSPTYLTAVATLSSFNEMGFLNAEDTSNVVHASDAIFSDLASGKEIKNSINDIKKSPMARLEILLNVAMDPILYRSVHDDNFFSNIITQLLWVKEVENNYRCYFLLHIPHFASKVLAMHLLFKHIPEALIKKDEPVTIYNSDRFENVTLTRFFNYYPVTFASIIIAIWTLSKNSDLSKNVTCWVTALKGTPYQYLFASVTITNKQKVAIDYAHMLLCNFVLSYSKHKDSYLQRFFVLKNNIRAEQRNNAFPFHLIKFITNAILVTRNHFQIETELLAELVINDFHTTYKKWYEGDNAAGKKLEKLLVENFISEQTIHEPRLTKVLRQSLLPKTEDVIKLAIKIFEEEIYNEYKTATRNRKENSTFKANINDYIIIDNKALGESAFGNTIFLSQTVAHLLLNARKYGINLELNQNTKINFNIKTEDNAEKHMVVFEVVSPQHISQEEIKRFFYAGGGGGLMTHKAVIESWGGEMGGYPIENDNCAFFVKVENFEMKRSPQK